MSYCSTCTAYLCDFCSQVHQRQKRYKDHQLKQGGTRATTKYICDKHSEPLKVFCQTCYCLVCCECIVQSHQKHVYKSVNSETRAGVDKVVGKLVNTAQRKADDLKDKIDYMSLVEKSVIERTERLKKEVDSAYKDILKKLDRTRAKIVDEIEKAGDKDLKLTWADKNSAELKSKSLNAALELAARAKKCTDIEMLRLSGQLIKTMETFGGLSLEVNHIKQVHHAAYTFQRQNFKVELGSISIVHQPERVPLGTKCSFRLQLLTKFEHQVKLPTVTASDIALTYGTSKKKMPTRKILVEKQHEHTWKVTFVPVCSGQHFIAISTFATSDTTSVSWSTFYFSVYGRPPLNSKVQRGPDWDSLASYKAGTADGGSTGTIRNCYSSLSKEMVMVDWQGGKHGHMCRWGSNGRYDVELASGL